MMREEVKVVSGELARVVKNLVRARRVVERTAAEAAAATARAERRLEGALGGMTLPRWRALVSDRTAIRSTGDCRDLQLAIRRRPRVEEALRELAATRTARDEKLAEARESLAVNEGRLVAYGSLAERVLADVLAGQLGDLAAEADQGAGGTASSERKVR